MVKGKFQIGLCRQWFFLKANCSILVCQCFRQVRWWHLEIGISLRRRVTDPEKARQESLLYMIIQISWAFFSIIRTYSCVARWARTSSHVFCLEWVSRHQLLIKCLRIPKRNRFQMIYSYHPYLLREVGGFRWPRERRRVSNKQYPAFVLSKLIICCGRKHCNCRVSKQFLWRGLSIPAKILSEIWRH